MKLLPLGLLLMISTILQGAELQGRIVYKGSAPHEILTLVTPQADYELSGPLLPQLIRLQGEQLQITGKITQKPIGPGRPAILRVESATLTAPPRQR